MNLSASHNCSMDISHGHGAVAGAHKYRKPMKNFPMVYWSAIFHLKQDCSFTLQISHRLMTNFWDMRVKAVSSSFFLGTHSIDKKNQPREKKPNPVTKHKPKPSNKLYRKTSLVTKQQVRIFKLTFTSECTVTTNLAQQEYEYLLS